jgi:hypothetical protein
MKTTHKMKVKIAKKMGRTEKDKVCNAPLFMTEGWERRKLSIKEKINAKRKAKVLGGVHNEKRK